MDVPGPWVCGWINGEDGSMVVSYNLRIYMGCIGVYNLLIRSPLIPALPEPGTSLGVQVDHFGKDVILFVGIYDQQFQRTISFNGL